MLVIGEKEADAVRSVIKSGKMFRYHEGGECDRFEKRWGEYTNTKYVCMTASGTNSLTAALAGLDVGPGDEVLVPALTYMATPIAVLAVGAIPVIHSVPLAPVPLFSWACSCPGTWPACRPLS